MSDRVRALIAEALRLPPESLTDALAFGEVRQWDSVGHINIMLALEKEFGIAIPDDDVGELTDVGAIRRYLAERGLAPADGVA